MDEDQELSRGRQAQSLLENPYLNEALDAIEKKYEDGWRNSNPASVDVREKAFVMLHVVKEFRMYLTNMMNTGKLANAAKEERIELSETQRKVDEWDGSPDGRA